MSENTPVDRTEVLIRQTLEVGGDLDLTLKERLQRLSSLVRRAFAAERGWVASGDGDVESIAHILAEDWRSGYPGVEPQEAAGSREALRTRVDVSGTECRATIAAEPFEELDSTRRGVYRYLGVRATVQASARVAAGGVLWVVGMDFCRQVPVWGERESRLFEEFTRAAAVVIELGLLFDQVEEVRSELEAVFEGQRDGVALLDGEGRVVRCNQSYTVLLGEDDASRLVGRLHSDYVAGLPGDESLPLAQAKARGEAVVTWQEDSAEGGRWLECNVRALAGRSELYLLVLRDVTVQRMLSDRATQKAKLESLGTLAGGVAHEFNNILQSILPAVERLGASSQTDVQAVEAITAAVTRAGDLTRRMLVLSPQHIAVIGKADLGEALEDVVVVLRGSLHKNIRIELVAESPLGWVGLEAAALHSVLLNLGTNARDAMPDGGTLRFGARVDRSGGDPRAAIEVSDSGKGMPADELAHIFDPFFTTKSVGDGVGLGLPLVYRLVSGAGGTITAHSAGAGQGSRFVVQLPLVSPPRPDSLAARSPSRSRLDGIRVLVVDDEDLVRQGVTVLLEDSGAEVTAFTSAEEALESFAAAPTAFDAAVVDHGLPGLDGGSLVAAMVERRPDLVAVLASGYSEELQVEQLHERDVKLFKKPFEVRELIDHLATALRRR